MAKNKALAFLENPDFFKNIIDFTDTPVIFWDKQFNITKFNPAFERLSGYKESHIIGKNLSLLFPHQSWLSRLVRLSGNKRWQKIEIPVQTRSGNSVFTLWNFARIYSSDRKTYIASFAYVHDITSQKNAEADLRQSRAMFKSVVDSSPLAIYLATGVDQIGEYLNPRFTELFGYTLKDIPSVAAWYPLAYPDPAYRRGLVEEWQRRVIIAHRTGKPIKPMEAVAVCKDGSRKTILWNFTSIGERNISYGLDLTDRIKSREDLLASEKKFRTVFENSPIPTSLLDLKGKLLMINKAGLNMSGFTSKKELARQNLSRLVAPAYYQKAALSWQQLLKKKSIHNVEMVQQKKDGTFINALISGVILNDAQGAPESILVMSQDITVRQKAETALKESKEKYKSQAVQLQAILDSTPAIIWIALDRQCKMIIGNQVAYRFSQVKPGVNLSKSTDRKDTSGAFQIFENGRKLEPRDMPIQRVARSGQPILDYEFDFVFADGTKKTLAGNVIPIFNGKSTPSGAVAAFIDITDRVQIEQRKDDFISVAAHELRTPLTSIKVYTEIVKGQLKPKPDSKTIHMLTRMDHQINKLSELVSDMLDVTRIKSGNLALRPEKFNLDTMIKEAISDIKAVLDSGTPGSNPFKFTFTRQAGQDVVGDKFRLSQVVSNLLSNAVKYNSDIRRVVISTLRRRDEIIVSIRDFGAGIPKNKQAHLFEKFYRITEPHNYPTKFTSLGLGLYISFNIIKQHHGRMWFKSVLGKGSTFYFSLPLK